MSSVGHSILIQIISLSILIWKSGEHLILKLAQSPSLTTEITLSGICHGVQQRIFCFTRLFGDWCECAAESSVSE
jgi:hypothetical protein